MKISAFSLEEDFVSPEQQLRDAMESEGLFPNEIIMDGMPHRFHAGEGKRNQDGWYQVSDCGPDSFGAFGDWKIGKTSWCAKGNKAKNPLEDAARRQRVETEKARLLSKKKAIQDAAAILCAEIWDNAKPAEADHPYLVKKQINTHGVRVRDDGRLIIPVYNADITLRSLQSINDNGTKRFFEGGELSGGFWWIGELVTGLPVIYLVEGFATAATIHEQTKATVIVAFSANNLHKVLVSLRVGFGKDQRIVIVADNDNSGAGIKEADKAAQQHGAEVVLIPIPGMDANDFLCNGHNLLALLNPKKAEWLVPCDEFFIQADPVRWLIKGIIQRKTLHSIFGPANCGKTFLALDMAMCIASGQDSWAGKKVTQGGVVYFAGEGHSGLRQRGAAWMQEWGVKNAQIHISLSAVAMNSQEGLEKIISHLKTLPVMPVLGIVDTQARHFDGDENSNRDMGLLISNLTYLSEMTGMAIILIHHSGVDANSQHRGRGASSMRGALGMEFSLTPAKTKNDPIVMTHRKAKDSEILENMCFKLKKVKINDWKDEDGEQVSSLVAHHIATVDTVERDMPKQYEEEEDESNEVKFRRYLERSWFASGAEFSASNYPYISKSALKHWLLENRITTSSVSAEQMLKPSEKKRMIGTLIIQGVVMPHENGFIVIETAMVHSLRLKNER